METKGSDQMTHHELVRRALLDAKEAALALTGNAVGAAKMRRALEALEAMRTENAALRADAERWKKAHDGILAEAERMVREARVDLEAENAALREKVERLELAKLQLSDLVRMYTDEGIQQREEIRSLSKHPGERRLPETATVRAASAERAPTTGNAAEAAATLGQSDQREKVGDCHQMYRSGIKVTCSKCGAYPVEQDRPNTDPPTHCVRCGAPYLPHGQCSRWEDGCQGGRGEHPNRNAVFHSDPRAKQGRDAATLGQSQEDWRQAAGGDARCATLGQDKSPYCGGLDGMHVIRGCDGLKHPGERFGSPQESKPAAGPSEEDGQHHGSNAAPPVQTDQREKEGGCHHHRSYNSCIRPSGHPGAHWAGGDLWWNDDGSNAAPGDCLSDPRAKQGGDGAAVPVPPDPPQECAARKALQSIRLAMSGAAPTDMGILLFHKDREEISKALKALSQPCPCEDLRQQLKTQETYTESILKPLRELLIFWGFDPSSWTNGAFLAVTARSHAAVLAVNDLTQLRTKQLEELQAELSALRQREAEDTARLDFVIENRSELWNRQLASREHIDRVRHDSTAFDAARKEADHATD